MPRPIRVCSTLDCGRQMHAKGLCKRCYDKAHSKSVVGYLPRKSTAEAKS